MDELTRLHETEMTVDPEYIEMLHQQVEEDLNETKEELKWDAEYAQRKTKVRQGGFNHQSFLTRLALVKKLFDYVKDELIVDTFSVKAIRKIGALVGTFKVKKMSEFLKQNLQEIYDVIEEERRNHEETTRAV